MKVLLLSNKSPWPPHDGGSAAVLSMIDCLNSRGVDIKVLAINTFKHFADNISIPPEFRKKADLHLVTHDSSVQLLQLTGNLLFSGKAYSNERFESASFRRELAAALNQKTDIIQVEGLTMTRYLGQIRSLTSAPVVFRPHNVECRIWSGLAKEEINPLRKFYSSVLARRLERAETGIMNSFDGLIAISDPDLEWFKRSGLSKPAVTVSPVARTIVAVPDETDPLSVFFIGALDWRPNIIGLRWLTGRVWPLVIAAVPGAVLHIAGRNPSGQLFFSDSTRNIVFHGEVGSATEFMKDKSIMVSPLFSGSGTRMKIIEGMSQGKCIVATPQAAAGVICEDGKDILIGTDAQSFARCIIGMITDDQLRKKIAHNSLENVRKNYDIFASADKLLNFYTRLLQ